MIGMRATSGRAAALLACILHLAVADAAEDVGRPHEIAGGQRKAALRGDAAVDDVDRVLRRLTCDHHRRAQPEVREGRRQILPVQRTHLGERAGAAKRLIRHHGFRLQREIGHDIRQQRRDHADVVAYLHHHLLLRGTCKTTHNSRCLSRVLIVVIKVIIEVFKGFINIQNEMGQIVYQNNIEGLNIVEYIDMVDFPNGLYVVTVGSEKGTKSLKLTKTK